MFLDKYLNDFYYEQVLDNYEEDFLNSLDEDNFIRIYQIFKSYNFYYIDDIILKYLEIFTLDEKSVLKGLKKLINDLGVDFVAIIGKNLTYLDTILKIEEDN